MPKKPISIPSGLALPWLVALVGAGMVASLLALLVVSLAGPVTIAGALWWCGNLVAWAALCLLLAGTEEPRIVWIVMRSTKLVEFSRAHLKRQLPKREIAAAAVFFGLLAVNWFRSFGDLTVILPLGAMALGTARIVRRAPFSRWQWIGAGLLIARELMQAASFARADFGTSWTTAVNAWFSVAIWWMLTHRAVKREDEALAARAALTQASYYIADGQFSLAEQQVRRALPLATTNEIASAALQVLAASLTGQVRLAEAERALEGAQDLTPDDAALAQRINEMKKAQLVIGS